MKFYTLAEAAAMFGVSTDTIKRRVAEAGVRPARVGRGIALSEAELEAVIEASRLRSPKPEPLHPWTAPVISPAPKGRLSRSEQGRRIQAGKREAAQWRAKGILK